MKFFKYIGLLFIGCATAGFQSCSHSDEDMPEPGKETVPTYYVALNISLPEISGTRTTTNENGGTTDLDGYDKENSVSSAAIYFFDAEEEKKLVTLSTGIEIDSKTVSGSSNNYTLTSEIQPSELALIFGKKVNVYVVANMNATAITTPTDGTTDEANFLRSTFTGSASNYIKKFYDTTAGTAGMACPMSNYDKYVMDLTEITLPANATTAQIIVAAQQLFDGTYTSTTTSSSGPLWDTSESKGDTYKSPGTLQLERMVARVDYKDGSTLNVPGLFTLAKATVNTEDVNYANNSSSGIYLKVASLQLFNLSTEAHTFRTISEGNATLGKRENGEVKVFGKENGNAAGSTNYNWIYDTDWDAKTSATSTDGGLTIPIHSKFLNQPTSTNGWGVSGDLAKNTLAEIYAWKDNSASSSYANDGYMPWYYIMENTVPSTSQMDVAHCTGIVFKVLVCKDATGAAIDKLLGDDSILRITMDDGTYKELEWDTDGYYLTYRYIIPHNIANGSNPDQVDGNTGSTGVASTLAPMQYGIVRNNVYQLSLKGINNLPDPHEPDNFYLAVELKVLAWAKHNITVSW